MTTAPQPARKVSNNPKRANGRGSRYQIPQKSGKKVWKAAIHDVTGKLRTKQFDRLAEAEDWLANQRRAHELGENTYATNPKMTLTGTFLATLPVVNSLGALGTISVTFNGGVYTTDVTPA